MPPESDARHPFFASCGKGLEYLLADELSALGSAHTSATIAGVNAQGSQRDALCAVLWSRLASRVLWPIAQFDAGDEHALYAGACAVPWQQHLDAGLTFAVDAHVSGSGITHARYAAQRVKDAVVDTLRAASGARPDVDTEAPDVLIDLVVRKGRAIVSIDLSGGAMHRRGWRRLQGEAPLKETLAAAVLLRGQWPQVWQAGGGLLDPMCGSGTLLIEGALIAADVAPGLLRHGAAVPSRWKGLDRDAWIALVQDARERERIGRASLRPVFSGRDNDPQAIAAARANAEAAGVADVIELGVADISALALDRLGGGHSGAGPGDHAPAATATSPWSSSPLLRAAATAHVDIDNDDAQPATDRPSAKAQHAGLVVCNPPYDIRLAAEPALYRALGEALRQVVPDWRGSLLCGDAELAFATGLRAKKKYQLFNGAVECTLIVVDPLQPAAHAQTMQPRALPDGAQMVANRLRKNLDRTKRWRQRNGIVNWRVYDADIPEYAAAVDVYTEAGGGRRWLHVQEYAAPADIPEEIARRRLNELLLALREVFELPKEQVAVKTRMVGKGGSKYGRFDQRGQLLAVTEGEARLRVNLFDYLDTGLFLDHRPIRQMIAQEARDTRFLNLFCYTGAATVQAAVGGAAQTTSVDLSATYLEWLADNLRENGIGGTRHRIVQADVLAWLAADTQRYDLIFCDPPTFSNSKRADDFDIQRDHVRLLQLAVARLAPGGVLYFSNNFRRFRLDRDAVEAFAEVEDISTQTIDQDFARNPRIHRSWRLRARTPTGAG